MGAWTCASRRTLVAIALAAVGALAGCSSSSTSSEPKANRRVVAIAAASDLRFALDEILADFRKEHPDVEVKPTYGSSGNFFAQLSSRAPFDVYLSADVEYPRRLVEAGLADADSEFTYAIGQIVVWALKDSPLDVERQGIQSLLDERARKIAIANPEHAPYGRAAEAALKELGVYEAVKPRLVLGVNIAQAAQFVESGAADVGVISHSLAISPAMRDRGKHWPVPSDAHPRIEQGGVIMNWAQDRAAAEAVRAFMVGPAGRELLKRHGFLLPGE